VDGVTLSITSGAMAAGDQFLVRPALPGAGGISLAVSDAAKIAAAAPVRTARGTANTGSATISAGSVNAPPPPNVNLQQPVTITITAANTFNVNGVGTGNPVGVAYTSGGNISYNGWTVQITGTPAVGDTFTIGPNTGGSSDNRNMLLLAGLQTSNTLANGTATYQSAYSQLVSQVGGQTQQAQINAQAQQAFLQQAQQSQQSFSGVNLDEEAANLVRYQQAYQASAKVMQIAEQVFNALLNLGS
jgi:flagellar hook-associated protein 1